LLNYFSLKHNAKLTGIFYGERFCVKMKRSGIHKNKRSKIFRVQLFVML
jgi:hypothetical protein